MMGGMKTRNLTMVLLGLAAALPAVADTLVFAVSTGSAMPMTSFRKGVLADGLLKDFGDALARELDMTPRYVSLPRKRVEGAVQGGGADLLCDMRPEWLDHPQWRWTEVVFANTMIVASRADTLPLRQLSDLDGERLGTLLGYLYPELERAMGGRFQRDDGATDDVNTRKLLSGRFRYMVSNALYYDYQRTVHPDRQRLHATVFPIRPFETFCALPMTGKLDFDKVNGAIASLRKRGDLQRMHLRYRPSP
jgi:polar amino acid transport system substrate-binding protein